MATSWTEVAKLELSQAKVEKIFVFDDGKVNVNAYGYADIMAVALSKEIPGRYTSCSKPSINKKSFVFRFVKQCASTSGCTKRWKIVCQTGSLLDGSNQFTAFTNDVDCVHIQTLTPRPLSGECVKSF